MGTALLQDLDPAVVPGRGAIAIIVTDGNADQEELCEQTRE